MNGHVIRVYSLAIPLLLWLPGPAMAVEQLSCLLEPSEEIEIASQVAGVVRHVNFNRGDNVRKGDVLLTLEQETEIAEVNLSRARVEFMDRKLERNQELIDKNLIADYEADEIVTDRKIAALELELAERKLEQKVIYSPVDGVVVERLVSKAEYASVDPLMVLAVLDPLHAEVVMSSEYYGTIKKGMQVEVVPLGLERDTRSGTVKIVDRIIDAASGTFGVQIEIPNPDHSLPAGLKCQVHFPVGE